MNISGGRKKSMRRPGDGLRQVRIPENARLSRRRSVAKNTGAGPGRMGMEKAPRSVNPDPGAGGGSRGPQNDDGAGPQDQSLIGQREDIPWPMGSFSRGTGTRPAAAEGGTLSRARPSGRRNWPAREISARHCTRRRRNSGTSRAGWRSRHRRPRGSAAGS